MRVALAIALLAGVGCVHADRAALVTSTATVACDWGYTHRAASDGWINKRGYITREANPIMGENPDPGIVAIYFSAVLVANVALWYATPPKYRAIVPFALTVQQAELIHYNSRTVGGVCGF